MSANLAEHTQLNEREPNASAGWKAEYAYQGVETSIEADIEGSAADRRQAASRDDRPDRYCRKHDHGGSS